MRLCDNKGMNDSNNQTIDTRYPNLIAYLDEAEIKLFIGSHTMAEADKLEAALELLESTFIDIYRTAEYELTGLIWGAIGSIWDNARDLAFDEDD